MRDTIVGTAILITLFFVGRYLIQRDKQAKEQGELFVRTLREIQTACDAEHRAQALQFLQQLGSSTEAIKTICAEHSATITAIMAQHSATIEGLSRRFDAQGSRVDGVTSEIARLTERLRAVGVIRDRPSE